MNLRSLTVGWALVGVGGLAAAGELQGLHALERASAMLERVPGLSHNPFGVLVRFEDGASEGYRSNVRALVGDGTAQRLGDVELVSLSVRVESAIELLRPLVAHVERDWVVRHTGVPNDTFMGLEWGMHNTGQSVNGDPGTAGADINAPQAWDITTGNASFAIAVIDSGTQYTHPDLAANIWTNPGEVASNGVDDDGNGLVDDVRGWDFYSNDNNPADEDGHGTHTAGTVGAVGNNGVGVAGVNWACKLVPLRFLGPQGGFTSGAIAAVNYCRVKGIKVSNNSWGGGGYSQSLSDAINNAKSIGHVFVAAAGNYNSNNDASPFYPASYAADNIISVAATTNDDGRWSSSNYGFNSVDLGAPGSNVASTYPTNNYAYLSGTSMASPHVAGVVALVYAQHPTWTYGQVRSRVLTTVRPVPAMNGITATGGVLDAYAAVNSSPSNTSPSVVISAPANNASVVVGTNVTFTGSASDAQDGNLTASLVWSSNLQGQLGTGGTFSRNDLVAGTHTITASATDSGSLVGNATVTLNVTSAGSPPSAPGTPVLTNLGAGQVRVQWADNSNNETNFQIQRQQRVGGQWVNTTTFTVGANTTQYNDAPGAGSRFRYRVRATNGSGASAWTSWRNINT